MANGEVFRQQQSQPYVEVPATLAIKVTQLRRIEMPAALATIAMLFLGFTVGVVVMALMTAAKNDSAEREGAAQLAAAVLDRMALWKFDGGKDGTMCFEEDIAQICGRALERGENHENNFVLDSTNG